MHLISNIVAAFLVATVVGCLLCAWLDPTFQNNNDVTIIVGGASVLDSTTYSVLSPSPLLSLIYQPRVPLVPRQRSSIDMDIDIDNKSRVQDDGTNSKTASVSTTAPSSKIPPVQVLVCVESLCIDSQRFFHNQLMIAMNALGSDVMNLTVVSFGNAKMPDDSSSDNNNNVSDITCQHGKAECDTNTYQQCAQHLYPNPAHYVPYMACLFEALPMGHRDTPFEARTGLEPCAHAQHLDFTLLKKCHDDPTLSWHLQQQAFEATPKRHDHVPWVEINGQYMDEESNNLLEQVCRTYQQAGGHSAGCSSIMNTLVG